MGNEMYKIEKNSDSSSLSRHIGSKLKSQRVAHGISQTKLGKMLGITCQQVQKYENGSNMISANTLYQISNLLNTDLRYFFRGYKDTIANAVSEESDLHYDFEGNDTIDGINKELAVISKHFKRIKSDKVRKRILDLVRALSAQTE